MKKLWQFMTSGDVFIILLLLVVSLAGMAWVAAMPEGSRIIVTSDKGVCFTSPINEPHNVDIDGPLGQTRLVIDDNGARITSSPCPRKICISMGSAKNSGDLLACVPNRILVRIDSPAGKEEPYDLLSR